MRQTRLGLSEFFSTKVSSTICGALLAYIVSVFAPAAFAVDIDANADTAQLEASEALETSEASEDSVRNALRSVFKETASGKLKEAADSRDKIAPPINKSAMLTVPKPAVIKAASEPEKDEEVKAPTNKAVEKPAAEKNAAVKANRKVAFTGVADYYADMFHGKKTASGQLHDKTKMTAAHLSLPFGTKVKVVSRHTGKSCVVTVNDRGPYTKNRIIDLSFAAAKELGLVTAGSRLVDCYLIEPE